jgi:hypothetical protein
MRALRLGVLVTAPVIAAACSSTGDTAPSPAGTESTITPAQSTTTKGPLTNLRIVFAGQQVNAQLADNPTARDLAHQLPITLPFRDLNRVEKIAKLARPLTTDGVPEGDDPEIADIGYYAPSQDLVLYYGDVGHWNGIVRIGRFDSDQLALVEGQPDGFEVTIEIA